jgi:hypothetical protein
MAEENSQISQEGIFTPEALIMFSLAGFVDIGEFFIEFIPVIGTILSVLLDIIAFLFIGAWMISRIARGQRSLITRKNKKTASRKKFLKVFSAIFEMVPMLSSLYPGWLIVVWLELKSK